MAKTVCRICADSALHKCCPCTAADTKKSVECIEMCWKIKKNMFFSFSFFFFIVVGFIPFPVHFKTDCTTSGNPAPYLQWRDFLHLLSPDNVKGVNVM